VTRRALGAATAAALLCLPLTAGAQDQPLALRPARVVVSPERAPLEGATLLLQGGKVAAVGVDLELPEGTRVVDLPRVWAVAGFVDASTEATLTGEVDEVTSAIQADVSTRHGLDFAHRDLAAARAAGVTTALVVPGERNLVGGEATLIKTTGAIWRLGGGAPVKLALGSEVLLEGRSPTSRVGAVDALRRCLAGIDRQGDDVLAQLARGERVALWRVGSALDARTALELGEHHGLALLLQLAPEVEAHDLGRLPLDGRPVLVGPYGHGTPAARLRTPAAVASRGGRPIFASGAPATPPAGLRLTACLAVHHGLDAALALDALTRAPAAALGIGERVGTLEPGKDADVVLLDGPPLDLRSRVVAVYVGGQPAFARPPEERP